MGVNPVGNAHKAFTFDNESSATYNTFITGTGAFNAPVRNVEMIEIPNRNGALALDHGNFENVELTYEAFIVADTVSEFSQAVSDLRNWLCSKQGYCRLTDDYNPNEYRLAVYRSGLEVAPFQATSGEFEIVFDCKPQRYLTSGETAVSVTSGDDITNPTKFESYPQLQVWGYGDINIGSDTITLTNQVIGNVLIAHAQEKTDTAPLSTPYTMTIDNTYAMSGDTIAVEQVRFDNVWTVNGFHGNSASASATTTGATVNATSTWGTLSGSKALTISTVIGSDGTLTFAYGTAKTETINVVVTVTASNYTGTYTFTVETQIAYDGDDTFTVSATYATTIPVATNRGIRSMKLSVSDVYLDSTMTALGTPTYIDLDIGEAYMVQNGSVASLNNTVSIPAELPSLPSGATEITYDNTVTQLKIVPRWWRV